MKSVIPFFVLSSVLFNMLFIGVSYMIPQLSYGIFLTVIGLAVYGSRHLYLRYYRSRYGNPSENELNDFKKVAEWMAILNFLLVAVFWFAIKLQILSVDTI